MLSQGTLNRNVELLFGSWRYFFLIGEWYRHTSKNDQKPARRCTKVFLDLNSCTLHRIFALKSFKEKKSS